MRIRGVNICKALKSGAWHIIGVLEVLNEIFCTCINAKLGMKSSHS